MYKKLKKQKGERFAQTIRNFHNGILEIPDLDVIVRYAGREAEPLLPYLMSLLATNDDKVDEAPAPANPFDLLEQAGYDAFYADTLEKKNSIITVPNPVLKAITSVATTLRIPLPYNPLVIPYATRYWFVDNRKAREELGVEFRSAADALVPTLEWLRETGRLDAN